MLMFIPHNFIDTGMSLHVLYVFLAYGADAWFCFESEKSSWMNGCRLDWMHLKMEEKLDEWMAGWRREDEREKRKRVFSQYIRRWWIIVSSFSRCGVCMSHCCGVAHVSHAQTIWFLDMFSLCRSESVHMLVSIKVNSAHCEQMNPKQTKNTWSTMTIRKDKVTGQQLETPP